MQFIQLKTTDHRWRRKLRDYFRTFHTAEPIIEEFEDEKFRSFASFPFSEVDKINNRSIVKVYVIEDLYGYIYLFRFSKYFFTYTNKTYCSLKIKIIKTISNQNVKKLFPFSAFIEQLNLSTAKILAVKKNFILLIREMFESKIIQENIKIILNKNNSIKQLTVHELTVSDINKKAVFVVFYELID